MARSVRQFTLELIELLGQEALETVRPFIGSDTVRESIRLIIDSPTEARLNVPYYWAPYYHDGRPGHGPAKKRALVFFPNKRDDPRTGGGANYPRTVADRVPLTRAQYRHFMLVNGQRRRAGLDPIMIVIPWPYGNRGKTTVGAAQGDPFFDEGLDVFDIIAERLAETQLDRYIRERVAEVFRRS